MRFITAEQIRHGLTWDRAMEALFRGHQNSQPRIQDIMLSDAPFSLFGRGVILPGLGAGMKVASIYPPNLERENPAPAEHAIFAVIDENSKRITAIVDGPELTRWKTAADSALASRMLSREDSKTLLVLGAGPIAAALLDAHMAVRPGLQNLLLWNRTPERLASIRKGLRQCGREAAIATDINAAIAEADIISSATASHNPLIAGAHVRPGTHIDLVGGFTPSMREADDDLMAKARVFVDYRPTAVEGSGDICVPIANGVLEVGDIAGDLFDMVRQTPKRKADDITVYKNAGGAHIDLMVAASLVSPS